MRMCKKCSILLNFVCFWVIVFVTFGGSVLIVCLFMGFKFVFFLESIKLLGLL